MPRIEKYYETKYYKRHLPDERKTRQADLNITINKQIPEGKEILVVGCSTGEDVQYLTDKNKVYGVDIMDKAVKEAQLKKSWPKKPILRRRGCPSRTTSLTLSYARMSLSTFLILNTSCRRSEGF